MINDAVLIDVGLNSCRASLLQGADKNQPCFTHNIEVHNRDFGGLCDVFEHFRTITGLSKLPSKVGIALAGPVRGRPTTYTNGKWSFTEAELKTKFGFQHVTVVNDVAALVAGLPWLGKKDLATIGSGTASGKTSVDEGRYAVIFADLGLGVAALTITKDGYEILDTEAGHATFAPATPIGKDVLRSLSKTIERVSWERIISAPGLVNIHRAICDLRDSPCAEITPVEIMLYGRTGVDAACVDTLEFFFSALGSFAGDVALNYCAESGVYVSSHILMETEGAIQKSGFRTLFENKGRFSGFVKNIPTFAIRNPSARLVGLSRILSRTSPKGSTLHPVPVPPTTKATATAVKSLPGREIDQSATKRAFAKAMDAIDQSILILSPDLEIESLTGASWGEDPSIGELFAPQTKIVAALTRLNDIGGLGLIDFDGGLPALIEKLERRESFTAARRLFGGRISELQGLPSEEGHYIIVSRDDTERRRRTGELEELTLRQRVTNLALTDTQRAVRNLLDNSGQGFLTVGPSLLVGAQFSAACERLLGEPPAGKSIVDLLGRGMTREANASMRATFESLFRDSDEFMRELKLGLLPTAFVIGDKSLTAAYKFLAESDQLMLIVTDVTETVLLTATVECERKRVEMIVLALTEGEAFAALVGDYRTFLGEELPLLLEQIGNPGTTALLYRQIHTYKGLLAQFSFHFSPPLLHAFETRLAAEKSWTVTAARMALGPNGLLAELERDLQNVSNVLGPDFLTSGRRISLSQNQLQTMEQAAKDILADNEGQAASPALRQLLETLASLSKLDVKAALALHGRGASALATRLQKDLVPIQIQGDMASLDAERGAEFLRSLVHVFRNAVDHGIELPEHRMQAGKPAEGTIACHVRNCDGWLEILIADDGHGVDRAALEARLIAAGLTASQVRDFSLEDLIFREGLSSRDNASEISGRGIGLAAVKNELKRLGGTVTVESERGVGTRLRFRLPTAPNAANNIQIPALERVRA